MDKQEQIGVLNKKVIELLGLTLKEGMPILCGPGNIQHMESTHPNDYLKYGDKIKEIIASPTYVSLNPSKGSIEYIKVFTDENNEHVLVAVRASGAGVLFARTLFVMDSVKVKKYHKKNAFKVYNL